MKQKLFVRAWRSPLRSWIVVLVVIGLLLVLGPIQSGWASSNIIVNSFSDDKVSNDGFCTLREAIIAANKDKKSGGRVGECIAGNGADTIILPAGTYLLTRSDSGQEDSSATGDLDIDGDLTIIGDGAQTTIIDGNIINNRVIDVVSGQVTISGVTIQNGNVPGDGGGLFNMAHLTLDSVIVTNNDASGIAGGIYNNSSGTLTMLNSTVTNNQADVDSSGLVNFGILSLTNSTISGHASKGLHNNGTVSLNGVTLADNDAVSLHNSSGIVNLSNSIVTSCAGTLTSQGNNLIQDSSGCTIGGNTTGNLIGLDPMLGPLADNGGPTPTHTLLIGSPALEAGNNATCPATDQRGITRPQGFTCDIGAFELENPPQPGPDFFVNTNDDGDDGVCSFDHCSLREAILAANSSSYLTIITFSILGSNEIVLQSALPTITEPVMVDGTTQSDGSVIITPASGVIGDGLTVNAGDSTIRGLEIISFAGHGIILQDNGGNLIEGNTIAFNGGDGIRVLVVIDNQLSGNNIHDNGGLSIDLNGDGRTENDLDDADTGANSAQNFPALISAVPSAGDLLVTGRLNSHPNTVYTIEFFASESCNLYGGGDQTFLGSTEVTTEASGDIYFKATGLAAASPPSFINATATDPNGNTSELSDCIAIGPDNIAWPYALDLNVPTDVAPVEVEQFLDKPGQSRWYRFEVQPGSKVIVTLTDLSANYDLTIYKDISQALNNLSSPQDLNLLGAEFAPDAFSPDAFSPDVFSPDVFSPDVFSPDVFSPDVFSPDVFSPDVFSPDVFSPDVFSPDVFSPDAFSPDVFSPDVFSPDVFSPDVFSPDVFSPDVFSAVQMQSLLGASGFQGTAGEGIALNVWNNTGHFYVRVRGFNGAYNAQLPFHLEVSALSGNCEDVASITIPSNYIVDANGYKTVILTDYWRLVGTAAEISGLQDRLADFAARPEVAGVIVDVGADARVAAANAQADAHLGCPYAKNIVADTIKELVDAYWAVNPLEYVVIVGDDSTIPFFRYPDNALLANESNYVPPVRDNTASQASLRLGFVLGQDAYGSQLDVSFNNDVIPVPNLPVGRLVESASDIATMLDAYLTTNGGVVSLSTSPLVTGYDFLEDVALAVQAELEAGTGAAATTLITPNNISPADPLSWTADDLREVLLDERHDITFLAGHFSASSALAADYESRLLAEEIVNAPANFTNVIVFSAGCHAGYNLVDADGIPLVTRELDWAQAFAQKGATLIAGTGYQYGDTDFIEYSERLYLEFSRQLRVGSGAVSIGQAMVAAKQDYLSNTPQMRGIHQKALIEATIFGFPMLSVDMPGTRAGGGPEPSTVGSINSFTTDPGLTLGLTYADLTIVPTFTEHMVPLDNLADPDSPVTALYLSGSDGVYTNPAEPALPLELINAGVPGTVLRGVGFRGGDYTDLQGVLPLSGAATTELRGVHALVPSDIFYPVKLWQTNYYGVLADPLGGPTNLALTPAQFQSATIGSQTGTMRRFDDVDLRLYYSNNVSSYGGGSVPAQAAPPAIVHVSAEPDGGVVSFEIDIVGSPAAGIQEAWITYTALDGFFAGQWQSLDLARDAMNSTRWQGWLNLNGTDPDNVRFIVQAVNGVGLVTMATNLGAYYVPGAPSSVPAQPTTLDLISPPTAGVYGSQATVSALLTSNGSPVAGAVVTIGLGSQTRLAVTNANGEVTVALNLLGLPGSYDLQASFGGAAGLAAAADSAPFTILKQNTMIALEQPASGYASDAALLIATLTDAVGRPLGEKNVFFVLSGANGAYSEAVITDYAGRAVLGELNSLVPGTYTANVYFSGAIMLHTGETVTLIDSRYNASSTTGSLTLFENVPQVQDDFYTTAEDSILFVSAADGVLSNDTAPVNDSPVAVLASGPANGNLSLNADGSFNYAPNANFNGSDSFTYIARNSAGDSVPATVTITIEAVNDAPAAADDDYMTILDAPLAISAPGILSNDGDVDGDALTTSLVSGTSNGSLALNADGSFTYTPTPGFTGTDSFTYMAFDGSLNSNVATVTIQVIPINTPPDCSAAHADVVAIWPPDKAFYPIHVIEITDGDGDNITLTITSIHQDERVGHGSNSPDGFGIGTDTAYVRAERAGNGDGRVYHIGFTADDGLGGSCSGNIRVPIVPHDQSGDIDDIDGGPLYDSTVPG